MPRGASGHGHRLDQPRRLGGHGAPEAEGLDVNVRPPALEGELGADVARRVGHMGITSSPLYVLPTLSALELTLRDLGEKTEAGAGVAAAQALFASGSA